MLQTYRKEAKKYNTGEIKELIQRHGKWKGSSTETGLRTEVQEKEDWKQRSTILVEYTENREMQGSK